MKACDSIIKKMVLKSREDSVAHTYDLVRCLFDILRDVMKSRTKQNEQINSQNQKEQSERELSLVKHLEIAIDVFKRSSQKVGKTGEREWQQVIDQQCYVLEELLKGDLKPSSKAQSEFELALKDFNFCLNKALETVVSQDDAMSSKFIDTGRHHA